MDDLDEIERILQDSNKGNVTLIGDGLTKQHFIELDYEPSNRGKLFEYHVLNNIWLSPNALELESKLALEKNEEAIIKDDESNNKTKVKKEQDQQTIFHTEVDKKTLENAKQRLLSEKKCDGDGDNSSDKSDGENFDYFFEKPEQIRANLLKKAFIIYKEALDEEFFKNKNYEKCIAKLNKALILDPTNIEFFLLRLDCFLFLSDFKSSLLAINKVISILALKSNESNNDHEDLIKDLNEKATFCHYMIGQSYFDLKFYMNALESFNKASELNPSSLAFKIRR
jgi:tetratricopeptide (TPR) repeat protein